MEKSIEKIVKLAEEYVEFGKEMRFPQNYTFLRENNPDWNTYSSLRGDKICVYFNNNYTTSSVTFGNIQIMFYNKRIDMPIKTTKSDLDNVIKDCSDFLSHLKSDLRNEIARKINGEKLQEIAELKAYIKDIENSL